jgi:hypothetical protein
MTRREMERKAIWVERYYDTRFGHDVEVRYDGEYLYQVAFEMNPFRGVKRFDPFTSTVPERGGLERLEE